SPPPWRAATLPFHPPGHLHRLPGSSALAQCLQPLAPGGRALHLRDRHLERQASRSPSVVPYPCCASCWRRTPTSGSSITCPSWGRFCPACPARSPLLLVASWVDGLNGHVRERGLPSDPRAYQEPLESADCPEHGQD